MSLQLEHVVVTPAERRYQTPLLLLHGAWHGAWCWQDALADFAKRGFEAHAISLRGHGRSDRPRQFNLCGLEDYLRDLATAVAAISPQPVVVGHSMGGYILQSYLTRRSLPGAVLLCSIPARGAFRFVGTLLVTQPLATLKMLLSGSTLHFVGTPELARDAFFRPTIPLGQLLLYTQLLVPESLRMVLDASLPVASGHAPKQTPLFMIAAERDRVFTLAEQRATAAAYGAELLIVPEAAHDLMLDPAWSVAADAIEQAVKAWEGGR